MIIRSATSRSPFSFFAASSPIAILQWMHLPVSGLYQSYQLYMICQTSSTACSMESRGSWYGETSRFGSILGLAKKGAAGRRPPRFMI